MITGQRTLEDLFKCEVVKKGHAAPQCKMRKRNYYAKKKMLHTKITKHAIAKIQKKGKKKRNKGKLKIQQNNH